MSSPVSPQRPRAPNSTGQTVSARILVAIPARNEAATIAGVVAAVPHDALAGCSITTLVFDDGSTDDTADVARSAGAEVVHASSPMGLASFFRAAVQEALERDADVLVNIDGDGQFDAGQIVDVAQPIIDGSADFVAADRFGEPGLRPPNMSRVKYYGNLWMTGLVRRITGLDVRDVSSGFRAYGREALLRINTQSRFTYTQESFLDLAVKGVRIAQVPVTVRYFAGRRSRIVRSLWRYIVFTLITIFRTVRDYRPLRTFGTAALVLLLPGLAAGGFVLVHFARTGGFTPYIFLALTSAYLVTLALIVALVGIASDMLAPLRRNQETLIYLARRQVYGQGCRAQGGGDEADAERGDGDPT